jgi:hypothetical protein
MQPKDHTGHLVAIDFETDVYIWTGVSPFYLFYCQPLTPEHSSTIFFFFSLSVFYYHNSLTCFVLVMAPIDYSAPHLRAPAPPTRLVRSNECLRGREIWLLSEKEINQVPPEGLAVAKTEKKNELTEWISLGSESDGPCNRWVVLKVSAAAIINQLPPWRDGAWPTKWRPRHSPFVAGGSAPFIARYLRRQNANFDGKFFKK